MREHSAALADAARQKDEFLAMLGHELRNPLAPIRTALELVRRAAHQDALTANAYDVMARQIAHMVRLLDDLLDVARITSGRITLEAQTIDLRRVVADAIDAPGQRPRRRQRTIALRSALVSLNPSTAAICLRPSSDCERYRSASAWRTSSWTLW